MLVQSLDDRQWQTATIHLGAYRLPEFVVGAISGARDFVPELSATRLRELGRKLLRDSGAGSSAGRVGGALAQAVNNAITGAAQVWPRPNGLYLGRSAEQPEIGDIRVSCAMTPPADITLIAQVTGDTFKKFVASNGAVFLLRGKKPVPAAVPAPVSPRAAA